MGLQDIAILSDEFLAETQGWKKNLALEALKKPINGEIKSKLSSRVKTKAFSERLQSPLTAIMQMR